MVLSDISGLAWEDSPCAHTIPWTSVPEGPPRSVVLSLQGFIPLKLHAYPISLILYPIWQGLHLSFSLSVCLWIVIIIWFSLWILSSDLSRLSFSIRVRFCLAESFQQNVLGLSTIFFLRFYVLISIAKSDHIVFHEYQVLEGQSPRWALREIRVNMTVCALGLRKLHSANCNLRISVSWDHQHGTLI